MGAAVLVGALPASPASAQTRPPTVPWRQLGPAQDLLVLRDGTVSKGPLKTCVSDVCQIGTVSVRREAIAWIGFRTAVASLPVAKSESEDEVHLRDGGHETGRIVGIGLEEVVTQKATFDRADVAWIHLAGAPVLRPSGSVGVPRHEEPRPSTPAIPAPPSVREPAPGPPPARPSSAPASSRFKDPVKPCPADRPLGGRIELEEDSVKSECRGSQRAMLRFPLVTLTHPGNSWIAKVGDFRATELHYDISSGGCSGKTRIGAEVCKAPGGRRSGTVTLGVAGPLGFSTLLANGTVLSNGSISFNTLRPEIDASLVLLDQRFSTSLECVGRTGSGTSGWGIGLGPFDIRPQGIDCPRNDEHRYCVPPSDCSYPADAAARLECFRHADRYAIIPFSGDASWTSPKASDPNYTLGVLRTKIHWEICCGCGAPPAPPEASTDRCPSTATADGLAQRNRGERSAKLSELLRRHQALDAETVESRAHLADYRKTIKACLIQSFAAKVIIALLAPEAEGVQVAEEVAEAWEWAETLGLAPPNGLQMIAKVVERVVNGEDPTTVLSPEGWQNFTETLAAMKKVEALLSANNVKEMEKSIEECSGAFLVSAETKLSAEKCVEHLKAATEMLPEISTLLNAIRQLDTDYPSLQYRAWAACVEHARCAGTPEGACAAKKPAGDWPDVP